MSSATERTLPAPGTVTIGTLERKAGNDWQPLGSAVTNEQGRITALYPEGQEFASGQYRVVFTTGDYYAKRRARDLAERAAPASRHGS